MSNTYRTTGHVADRDNALAALRRRASEWDVALQDVDQGFRFSVWGSNADFYAAPAGMRIELAAPEDRLLKTLQGSLTELFEDDGLTIRWNEVDEGALAPGLALMQVVSVARRSPGFMRVRLEGPEAQRLGNGGLHFRLLLPPYGRDPRWPRIAATGRTVWPEGEHTLHRPVYTTVEQQDEWLDFDVFRHDGSPTADWTQRDPVGQTVGVIGPGGGSCPAASSLLMFGDESALPAISRMLKDAPGTARAYIRAGEEDLCELCEDQRVCRVADLNAALDAVQAPPETFFWFAGHCDAAKAARSQLAARGIPKQNFMAAAYWA